jgi:hypothetical protein
MYAERGYFESDRLLFALQLALSTQLRKGVPCYLPLRTQRRLPHPFTAFGCSRAFPRPPLQRSATCGLACPPRALAAAYRSAASARSAAAGALWSAGTVRRWELRIFTLGGATLTINAVRPKPADWLPDEVAQ